MQDDLRSLCQVIARAVKASGLAYRDVERALQLRNGTLVQLLNCNLDLQVEHLTALARLLRVPPGDLLRLGCPQTRAAATHRLSDWIGPIDTAPAALVVSTTAATSPVSEELVEMIRAAIREELAERKPLARD